MGKLAKAFEVKITKSKGFGGVGVAQAEILRLEVGNMSNFKLTVKSTASLTVNYDIKTGPTLENTYDVSQTSTTVAAAGVKEHIFVDNCDGFISILASATAAYASGAVTFVLSSTER